MPARMLEMPAQFEINTGHDLIDAGFDYCNLSVDDFRTDSSQHSG
jgi:hypothetical protein